MAVRLLGLFGFALVLVFAAQASALTAFPLLFQDSFERGADRWRFADRPDAKPTWMIESEDRAGKQEHYLRTAGGSRYEPPYRSPFNLAVLKSPVVSDFQLTVRLQNTNREAGDHRDLCLFWGYQDPGHFYYVHLGAVPDEVSCQVHIVDGADRRAITEKKSPGIPWDDEWHQARVTRDTSTGSMEIFFDDMQTPAMTARDKTFTWGRVGLGSFDDHGNFDDFELRGVAVEPVPAAAKLPQEN